MVKGNRSIVIAAALLGVSGLLVVGCGQLPEEPARAPAKVQSRTPEVQLSIAQGSVDDCADPSSATCTPSGAHGSMASVPGHSGYACSVCHFVAGRLAFDPNGPAYTGWTAAKPRPSFDATSKTCSNVACHTVPPGSYSYWFPGGDGEPEYKTVNYGGGPPRQTPSWYTTGSITCTACHDDPPRNGSDGSNAWHSGFHGNQGPTSAFNQCQLCHPNASSPNNGIGDTITNPALHANGTATVQATFRSACFGCH